MGVQVLTTQRPPGKFPRWIRQRRSAPKIRQAADRVALPEVTPSDDRLAFARQTEMALGRRECESEISAHRAIKFCEIVWRPLVARDFGFERRFKRIAPLKDRDVGRGAGFRYGQNDRG